MPSQWQFGGTQLILSGLKPPLWWASYCIRILAAFITNKVSISCVVNPHPDSEITVGYVEQWTWSWNMFDEYSWIRGGFPSTLWSQCSDLYWVYMSSLLIIRLTSAWCLTCICPFTSAPGCLSLLVHPQKLFMTYRLGLQRYHFIQTEYEYFHLCACWYWVLITIFLPQK